MNFLALSFCFVAGAAVVHGQTFKWEACGSGASFKVLHTSIYRKHQTHLQVKNVTIAPNPAVAGKVRSHLEY